MTAKRKQRLQMQKPAPTAAQITKMLDEAPSKSLEIPRINQYTCETCGGVITTIDRVEGTTPMFLNCRATPGCEGRSVSSMYRVNPHLKPDWEWYRPKKAKGANREYVEMGGLLIRRIGEAT